MSFVSFPVTINGFANCAVTTHEPCGMGDVAKIGLGTVVAPGGACPVLKKPKPEYLPSKAQKPCNLFAFTITVESFTLKLLR